MSAALTAHPRLLELVERRKLRKQVARAVSRLIAVLDDLDGDPEAEPSLGATELPASCSAAVYVPGEGGACHLS